MVKSGDVSAWGPLACLISPTPWRRIIPGDSTAPCCSREARGSDGFQMQCGMLSSQAAPIDRSKAVSPLRSATALHGAGAFIERLLETIGDWPIGDSLVIGH
jgi:hypothetical protein